ncbi:MAG: single-stranded DNA-binding protein [Oscillospiraceae bacterium]|nr:single-stranded DNA-binding protein [Oscillospiraceae bacterium]MCR5166237.1 single-stranded DNA-binding protein [Oscillospiraceae bacterium]
MLGSCAINKVILMGRLTRDPELRQSQSGTVSCRLSVAIDRPLSSAAAQSGAERQTDFISVVCFNKTAEFVSKYFVKGRLILVEGSLRTGSYTDSKYPDVKHYTTDVWADNISFGETKSSSAGYQSPSGGYAQGGYSAPAPSGYDAPKQIQQPAPSVSVGQLDDFEEIISDSDLPF